MPAASLPRTTQTPSQKAAKSRQRHEAPSVLTRLREVVVLEVRTLQEQKLGTVDDVILDLLAGRVVAVVVASGGVLGVGATHRTVPPAAFHYDEGKNVLHVDITKESFELNPTFDPSRWAEYRHQPAGVVGAYRNPKVTPDSAKDPVNADNSAVNRRDRDGRTLTPLDQGRSESDTKMTARIRKEVLAQDGLSVSARNVKIITVNGRVTLRGPVESEQERRLIGELAEPTPLASWTTSSK